MVKLGRVSQVNAKNQTVQVLFDDLDQTTSNDLPLIYPFTLKNRVPRGPELNEEVICVFLEGGSDGFCIGTYANAMTQPGTKERFEFEDGTILEYDTIAHHLLAEVKGSVTLKGENILLDGAATLKGHVTIEGDLTITGSITENGDAHKRLGE